MPLPVNIDTTYPDSAESPGRKAHQQHHDLLHTQYNRLETFDPATSGGTHPDLAAHDTLGLATQAELDAAVAARVPVALVDAAGDLLVGTGPDAIGRLAKGAALEVLRVNAGGTALEYAAAAAGAVSMPPHTVHPALQNNARGVSGANQAVYFRVAGAGSVSSIVVRVSASSGNIDVAVVGSAGGRGAPTTRRASSGSIPCPAAGAATIALGSTVAVDESDYFAIGADNTTATFFSHNAANTTEAPDAFNAGFAYYDNNAGAFPIPATSPTFTVAIRGWVIAMMGA